MKDLHVDRFAGGVLSCIVFSISRSVVVSGYFKSPTMSIGNGNLMVNRGDFDVFVVKVRFASIQCRLNSRANQTKSQRKPGQLSLGNLLDVPRFSRALLYRNMANCV